MYLVFEICCCCRIFRPTLTRDVNVCDVCQMYVVGQVGLGLGQLLYRHDASKRVLHRVDEVATLQHGWLHRAYAAVLSVSAGHFRVGQYRDIQQLPAHRGFHIIRTVLHVKACSHRLW